MVFIPDSVGSVTLAVFIVTVAVASVTVVLVDVVIINVFFIFVYLSILVFLNYKLYLLFFFKFSLIV